LLSGKNRQPRSKSTCPSDNLHAGDKIRVVGLKVRPDGA